jgi:nitrogen fixation protein FixH
MFCREAGLALLGKAGTKEPSTLKREKNYGFRRRLVRNTNFLVMITVLALIIAGCHKQNSEPAAHASANNPATSSWKLALAMVPDPPLSDRPIIFHLRVTDMAGKPITGAHVTAALIMPLMDMGKNEVAFIDKGEGNYEGPGKFNMAGPWNVLVTASVQGKSGQQTFAVSVRE